MKYPAIQNYINGKFVPASVSKIINVVSPLDGNLLSTVPMSTSKDLDDAVKAAQAAFPGWSKTPIKERVQVFFRYKYLLEKHLKELAELCSEENGKTYGESVAIVLSAENKKQFFVPRGFAHGFLVLSETATFFYKCDNFYNKESEGGIIYNDSSLNIDWSFPENQLIVSEKDKVQPTFKNAKNAW